MNIKHFIYRNLQKNIKNYYLYIFALIFSVALYFSFVTLRYDPSMDKIKESVKGEAFIQVGSVLLILIVTIFLLYANNLFIKQRGKEIGLFQLVGMTKRKIFTILSAENLILYFSSLIVGVFLGFAVSKLIMLIMFKLTGIEVVATLRFSLTALGETLIIFAIIYLLIMFMNYIYIRRQSILNLFDSTATTEEKVRKLSFTSIVIGVLGIGFIIIGYYISTKLFSGNYPGLQLIFAMLAILGSIIVGTYLFYKGSVSFIFNLIRKRKDGYVTLNNVLSLSPIMFRMKSNAFLLTIITLLSALAISLLSLTYITYYTAETTAKKWVPNDFVFFTQKDVELFTTTLEENKIAYSTNTINIIKVYSDITGALVPGSFEHLDIGEDPVMPMSVISAESIAHLDLGVNEALLSQPEDILEQMLAFKDYGTIKFFNEEHISTSNYIGMKEESVLPLRLTEGFPVAIVNETLYKQLANHIDPTIQDDFSVYIGVDIDQAKYLEQANDIFHELQLNKWGGVWEGYDSRLELSTILKQSVGLTIFVVGFLGLAFLITSGCILYFKQMGESELEKSNYTILRKLGFTQDDLLRGIRIKQLVNFGIPLVLGLCHSYFSVKSGWFIFGSEMWTPMITVMVFYTVLYSIFGLLSVYHYKQVLKETL